MIAQADILSGHDIEILLGEGYIRALLLSSLETGDFPTALTVPIQGGAVDIVLYAPTDIPRGYAPNPGAAPFPTTALPAFVVTVLAGAAGDLRVALVIDASLRLGNGGPVPLANSAPLVVDVTVTVVSSVNSNGLAVPTLTLTPVVVSSTDPVLAPLLGNPANQGAILATLAGLLGQGVPGGLLGPPGTVQAVRLRKHTGADARRALGIYVNLLLRTGFDAAEIVADRGRVADAVNFLPAGQDFALGVNPNLFELLGDHLRVGIAEGMNGNDDDYNLAYDGREIGYLKRVTVKVVKARYDLGPGKKSEPTSALRVRVSINAVPYGNDVAIEQFLFPILGADGMVTWVTTSDVDSDLLFEFVPLFFVFLISVLNPIAGLLVGQLLAATLLAANPIVADYVSDQLAGSDAADTATGSLASLLPQRVTVSARRWDPFYTTWHQVVVPFDFFELDDDGMVACGRAELGNLPAPIGHVVVRHEDRVGGGLARLRYRVRGFRPTDPDYTLTLPPTDRRGWTVETGDPEPDILSLPLGEATARCAEGRIRTGIPYVAQGVDVRSNQVRSILVLSATEITEGGATPRLDLSPRELGELQGARALFLRGFVLIERKGVPYYRDDADGSVANNLMSLPVHRSEDV